MSVAVLVHALLVGTVVLFVPCVSSCRLVLSAESLFWC